ncbi:hypothetical protein [Nitrosopumilus ureiphilus]|uniref:Uncharacterized protein n=1 Tax=Nitrosopumilus ureiphilus TaxID=1470067 RepID=A0A7D5M8T3_9ARCH|nr:hypothetical protein [Nitrosopumilus ureiphilus]QLH07370.1 hypothetical protein C5F50_10035 [Nitrosopumilus ureiphilus]
MSIRKPVIRKPKIPKIKKPLISKRKRVIKKSPSLSLGRIKTTLTSKKPIIRKKISPKKHLGTCYLEKNCKGVLSKKVTKTHCKSQGGKSWKKSGGTCEIL